MNIDPVIRGLQKTIKALNSDIENIDMQIICGIAQDYLQSQKKEIERLKEIEHKYNELCR